MAVSSVSSNSNLNLGALQTATVNELVNKLGKNYLDIEGQVVDAGSKISNLGQIQSGFATVQSKADTLAAADSSNVQARFTDVIQALNDQASLVNNKVAAGSILAKEVGSADTLRSVVSPNSLLGQTTLKNYGLSVGSDGTLSLDAVAFAAALAANPSQVTQIVSGLGGAVSGETTNQLTVGTASQTTAQSKYDALSTKQNALSDRISNLQNGGIAAGTLQDYSTLTTIVSSAGTRLNTLQNKADSLTNSVNAAGQKQNDLAQVNAGVASINSSAQALSAQATVDTGNPAADAAAARASLVSLFSSLNTQSTLVSSLTAAKTSSTSAGSLFSESALRTSLSSLLQTIQPSSLGFQLSFGSTSVVQLNGGQYSVADASAFDAAFVANPSSVKSLLANIGGQVSTAAGALQAFGSTLNNAQVKTSNNIVDLQNQIFANQASIDALQNDPFSAVPASSYKKILAM